MPDLGIVVPFYNEEATAGLVARELLAVLRASGLEYEVALVADGSTDGTVAALRDASEGDERVTVVCDAKAEGYGAAILHGLGLLRAGIVGWTDGDGQVPCVNLVEIREQMRRTGADLGMGIRQARRDGVVRGVASGGYNWLMRRMLGVRFQDINAKPKLITRSLLEEVAPRSKDWFIDTELVVGAILRGASVVRVPVAFLAREHGASKVRGSILREYWRNLRAYRARLRAGGLLGRRTRVGIRANPEREEGDRGAED